MAAIKSAMEALQQSAIKIGEAMYKAQAESQKSESQNSDTASAEKKDEPIKGDFEEVKKSNLLSFWRRPESKKITYDKNLLCLCIS